MFWQTHQTSIASQSIRGNSRRSNFFKAHSSWCKLPAAKKNSLDARGCGGVTRDFLKKIAKKGVFRHFFGEGGAFSGSGGQV